VLVADDQPDVLQALRLLLSDAGLCGEFVTSPAAVIDRVTPGAYALLLMDLNYARDTTSGREGFDLLAHVRRVDDELPVVVMTGWGTIETAVEAMRRGARSFVQKPWDNDALLDIVTREIRDAEAARRRDVQHQRDEREARLIQRALLPAPRRQAGPFAIAARWQPSGGFGGDCYDILPSDDGTLALTIADIAGKGLPAALLMSTLQASVRAFAADAADPNRICATVNRLLCRTMPSGRFATLGCVHLDPASSTLRYALAGHNPPLLLRRTGERMRLDRGGTVLGVFTDAVYDGASVPLAPGDVIVLFTDGIVEAANPVGEEYGDDRLCAIVERTSRRSPDEIVDAVFTDVEAFAHDGLQDDATVVVVKVG
jgi:sigma-B regulation protein RsbU (phosphoserine phosphatase)